MLRCWALGSQCVAEVPEGGRRMQAPANVARSVVAQARHRALGKRFFPLPITYYLLPIISLRDSISIQANMILSKF
jgi:hypothetical protein